MKKIILLTIAFFSFISCSTQQKVAVDYDRDFDFNANRTYTFSQSDYLKLNDLDSARLFNSIEKGLLYKGFQKNNSSNIVISVYPEEYVSKQQNSSVGLGMGTGGFGRIGGGLSVGIPITSEKLNQNYTVSMLDQGHLVWQGTLKIQMSVNSSPEAKEAIIQRGVMKLFYKFPPTKK